MDIEVNTLAQIKAETGRDLDNQVDENTLVSGEKSNGTFGVFKLFAAIKNCIDNWITTIAGNKNFTGAVTINSKAVATTEAVNIALANYRKKGIVIGYLDSSEKWFKISASNVRLTCRYGETVELYDNDEKSAIRINKGYEKITSVLFKDGFWYVFVMPWAEGVFCQSIDNVDFTAEEVTTLPAGATDVGITQIATKNDLNNQVVTFSTNGFTVSQIIEGAIRRSGKIIVANIYGFTTKVITANTPFITNLPHPAADFHVFVPEIGELVITTEGALHCMEELPASKWLVTEIVYIEA